MIANSLGYPNFRPGVAEQPTIWLRDRLQRGEGAMLGESHRWQGWIKVSYVKLVIAGIFLVAPGAVADPLFVNRAPEQQFEHTYDGGWEFFVGGGVATLDCNDDHFPDLFVAGGANSARLLVNDTRTIGGALRFTPVPSPVDSYRQVLGAYPLDVDSDGIQDLFVLRLGENHLWRGLGECRFSMANPAWQFDGSNRWTTAFSATWETGQFFPTLAVGNYVDRTNPKGPFGTCDGNQLYRPTGQSYADSAISLPGYCALSMLFSDWARQGNRDLRISNDRHYYARNGHEQLIRLAPNPYSFTEADGFQTLRIWGMGISSRDITGDGLPEVFLTSMGDQKLRTLAAGPNTPTYRDASYEFGTTAHRPYTGDEGRPSSGWHADFGDFNNDGHDDLFIAKGNVNQMPDSAMQDPNNLLLRDPDGQFVEMGDAAGIDSIERARGASVVDLNLDGKLDIVVINRRANFELYENLTTPVGRYLKLQVRQPRINRAAIGAWLELRSDTRTWMREITIGGGHASGVTGFEHFGVGALDQISYRVTWPDGQTSDWYASETNRHLVVTRLTGKRLEQSAPKGLD